MTTGTQPDEGIWETRGGRRDFTYGRFQTWVALDRAIRMAAQRAHPANLARWTAERDTVYNQIMQRGWNPETAAFTQHYSRDYGGALNQARDGHAHRKVATMPDGQTPRTDRPAEGVDLPLPGIKTAHDIQDAQEHLVDADADLESNELHAGGQACARCGRAIRPEDDVRRTASGTYQHEVCELP